MTFSPDNIPSSILTEGAKASLNSERNYVKSRVWNLTGEYWNNANWNWEDDTFFGSNLKPSSAFKHESVQDLSMQVNGKITSTPFVLNGIAFPTITELEAYTDYHNIKPIKRSGTGVAWIAPEATEGVISDNFMYWSVATQSVNLLPSIFNTYAGASSSKEHYYIRDILSGDYADGKTGSFLGPLTSIEWRKYYEVRYSDTSSILNLSFLNNQPVEGKIDTRFHNDYELTNRDALPASNFTIGAVSNAKYTPNVKIAPSYTRANTVKRIYEDSFDNIEDTFLTTEKYFTDASSWDDNNLISEDMTLNTKGGVSWQAL